MEKDEERGNTKDMEKRSTPTTQAQPRSCNCSWTRRSRIKHVGLFGILLLVLLWRSGGLGILHTKVQSWRGRIEQKPVPVQQDEESSNKVQLEAHIMSKCPDARDCLQRLVVPAMARVSSKVNFTLSFIGRATDPDDGVVCKHGPTECLGNILDLCAAQLYRDPKLSLGFANCLTASYEHIPERALVRNCALEHGLSFEAINDCASSDDGFGMDLLRASVTRSTEAGVSISCTIRLQEEVRCVRDAGEWKNCERGSSVQSLVHDIEQVWNQLNQ